MEAINGELRAAWGNQGSRSLAQDLLVSTTRQIRALRRLGIAGAGKGKPAEPTAAGTRRAESGSKGSEGARPSKDTPVTEEARARSSTRSLPPVKKEPEPAAEESGSDFSESGESEELEEDKEVDRRRESGSLAPGLTAAPKAKPEERSEIPRRRQSERPREDDRTSRGRERERPEGERDRADERRARSRPAHREGDRDRSRRGDHPREERDHRRSRSHRKGRDGEHHKSRRRRRNKPHRAGGKHQRLYRAAADPFKRLHYKQPDSFWDQTPGLH